jgi:hypothetical protein
VFGDVVDEQPGGHTLAREPSLHVGERHDDRIDITGSNQLLEFAQSQHDEKSTIGCHSSVHLLVKFTQLSCPKVGHQTIEALLSLGRTGLSPPSASERSEQCQRVMKR